MSAPCYVTEFAVEATIPGTTIELTGKEGHHAATVRRTRVGERVDLVNGAGGRLQCDVAAVDRGSLLLNVRAAEAEPQPDPKIVLIQALAKGGRDEQAVETSTEFGVAGIVPWQAERSIATWRGKEDKGRTRWQDTAIAAAKQSRRAWIPDVAFPLSSDGVASMLASGIASGAVAAICHEEAITPLTSAVYLTAGQKVFVVVGPEGGITPHERDLFEEAGAITCLLGPHVLRSATAGPYAIATLMASRSLGPLD